MKHPKLTKYLPHLSLACGLLAWILGSLLYATGVDSLGLLERGHPLGLLRWLTVLAAALLLAVGVFPLDGSDRYEDNFPASLPGAAGSFAAAAGIAATVLTDGGLYPDALTRVWTLGGILAGACLCVTGVCRLKGKKPLFLLHALVCLFLALNLANCYRKWSGDPQTQNYVFQLLASVLLMLSAYYRAAFEAGLGRRRAQLFSGMLSAVLCLAALAHTQTPFFYLGGSVWCLLNLCPLTPPKRRRRPKAPEPESPEPEEAQ